MTTFARTKNQCIAININNIYTKHFTTMYWTLELASKLEDAPWPATKEEPIADAKRRLLLQRGGVLVSKIYITT